MLQSLPLKQSISWQEQLAKLITDPVELLALLGLQPAEAGYDAAALQDFPLRVTRAFAARMERGNPDDPLLKQVLPVHQETLEYPGYSTDPLLESTALKEPALLHKYAGRVLLITTGACAIHCRYCFRRHFPYAEHRPDRLQWQHSLDYIRNHDDISEVILSGGDPLAVSNRHLQWLLDAVGELPQIKRIRLHTRLPVVLPDRIDAPMQHLLATHQGKLVVVIHANHANELDTEVAAACHRMAACGVTLLNQSVLLKGINDSAEALCQLSEALFALRVLPYYLHLLDKVTGAAHFSVAEAEAIRLHQEMQVRLPGYLVPTLVREDSGARGKTRLA